MNETAPLPATIAEPSPGDLPQLRGNSLDIRHAIIISVAVMSPAASVFFNTIPQGQAVGAAIPLCYAVGFVISLLVANSYSEFSRQIHSSGSSYTFITQSIGPRFGFMSAWAGLLAVLLGVPYTFVGLGNNLETIINRQFGFDLSWIFYSVLLLGVAFAICYSGIRQSLNVDFTFLAVEIAVCLLLAGIVLFHVGQQGGLSAAPFTISVIPTGGQGLVSNLISGIILGVLSFIGFETAASLGSEARNPKRSIPRAVYGSMILVGIFYLVMVYAETMGYGMNNIAHGFQTESAPFDTISRHFSPWLTIFVDLVGVFSFFSAGIGILNGSARIMFTVAREGLLPGFLGILHPTRHTPVGAITALCVGGGIIGIVMGTIMNPSNAFAFFATIDALAVLIIYMLVCAGTLFFFGNLRRQGNVRFNLLRHSIMPGIATLLIMAIFVLVIIAPQSTGVADSTAAMLLNAIPFIVAGWVVIGIGVIIALGKKLTTNPVAL
jgi:amino acid transporter